VNEGVNINAKLFLAPISRRHSPALASFDQSTKAIGREHGDLVFDGITPKGTGDQLGRVR
jgi:hypothetical protein